MRNITIDFSKTNDNTFPHFGRRVAGYIGEHNATKLKFILPEDFQADYYRVVFVTGGEVLRSERFDTHPIDVLLWSQLTANVQLSAQVEGYANDKTLLVKSPLCTGLMFLPSAEGKAEEADEKLQSFEAEITRILADIPWALSTGITGENTEPQIFPESGFENARENLYALNPKTGNLYRCTVGGDPQTALWSFVIKINGTDGVSVVNVEQTETSTESEGENIFTVTLSNGESFAFSVFNGSQGEKGDQGDSPTVELSKTDSGVLISIKNPDGESVSTAEVLNGTDAYAQKTSVSQSGAKTTITIKEPDGTTNQSEIYNSLASESSTVMLYGNDITYRSSGQHQIKPSLKTRYESMFGVGSTPKIGDLYIESVFGNILVCTQFSDWNVLNYTSIGSIKEVPNVEAKSLFIPADSLDIFPHMVGTGDVYIGIFNLPYVGTGDSPNILTESSNVLGVDIVIKGDDGLSIYHLARLTNEGLIESDCSITTYSTFPSHVDITSGFLLSYPLIYFGVSVGGATNKLAEIANGSDSRTIDGVWVHYI